jgi:hypothetical protein
LKDVGNAFEAPFDTKNEEKITSEKILFTKFHIKKLVKMYGYN